MSVWVGVCTLAAALNSVLEFRSRTVSVAFTVLVNYISGEVKAGQCCLKL